MSASPDPRSPIPRALAQIESVVLGKPQVVRLALACLIARGHLLIEDVPGVGKTTLARALAATLGLSWRRIQCVADLLPGDILGSSVYDSASGGFRFHRGPVFASIVLADELNRTSPRTQSALLEAMEEGAVTSEGVRHQLPEPFFVIATQNPREQAGTWPLPESQLDRFLMVLSLGFPSRDDERRLLASAAVRSAVESLSPVLTASDLVAAQAAAALVHVSEPVREYLLDLIEASRGAAASGVAAQTANGLSPRATLGWQRAAQAWALLSGRDAVYPEDVQAVATAVAAHRIGGPARVERLLRDVRVR